MTRLLKFSLLLTPVFLFPAFGQTDAVFEYRIGGTVPTPEYFSVTAKTPGTVASGLTVRTSGQSWLFASLSSTTTPSILTISVNPTGLSAGFYYGTVQVINPVSTLDFTVSLTVTNPPPPLSASPSSLTFNAVQGSAPPPTQTLQIGASTPGATVFSSLTTTPVPTWANIDWFGIGTAPINIPISIKPNFSTLNPGTYNFSIRFYTIFPDEREVTVSVTLNVSIPPPVLKVTANSLQFQYLVGSTVPAAQSIQVTSSGAQLATSVTSSVPWLSTSALTGTTPYSFDVKVNPAGLAVGTYRGQVVVSTAAFNSPSTQAIDVTLTVVPDERPVITSVINAASFKPAIGPGMWISIIGSNLAKVTAQATTAVLPLSFNGVNVQLRCAGGIYDALVHYISPKQINAFLPHEVSTLFFNTTCDVAVVVPTGTASLPLTFQALAPGLFSYGTERFASAVHPDGKIVGVIPGTAPVAAGGIVSLYGTGFGQTNPACSNVNGVITPRVLASDVVISIGKYQVKPLWAGMVGIGLYQFNVQLPDDLTAGDYPTTILINGLTTEIVLLPVR